ncbi:MAG: antitoxin [Deltaproteobacteria bacterium]|nr:antitoxin [Deltaproteobacteria bacterium]
MSKRLQVLLDARDYRSFQQMAKGAGLSLGEWVRQALRRIGENTTTRSPHNKLENIRKASRFHYPTGDIETILHEIEKGYLEP